MLEFQQEFLKPEIRNGFFLDATMKSVWAAELEVLSQVAIVCERHGIQWYAAYGTLLGAIRHEGFVPWDDDIDIWVMRKDYDRLMKEWLPSELPEEYVVKSSLNETGYDQFHSCVLNGDGISIEPERLKAYYGCVFTVGIDIFPLDYIPADAQKREFQKTMGELAGQAADLAFQLDADKLDAQEKNEAIQNIKDAMDCLGNRCRYRFEKRWLKEKNWYRVGCDLLNCIHAMAGRCDEKEGAFISEYWHFIVWDRKWPKDWFAETYSATFEDFMLPIPSGYDELLHQMYGDYMKFVKNSAIHEYPFYAKQLRQLREMVKQREAEAVAKGLIPERKEQEHIAPVDWRERLGGKKVILYISGLPMYSEFGEKALDKLESNFSLFKENKDKILLWWRPQTQMRILLGLLSAELVHRYDAILKDYKEAGWGICDESDDIERSIEYCDAYYGEVGWAAQTVQKAGKPVMIEQIVN